MTTKVEHDIDVRQFRVDIPEDTIVDLRRRLVTTRWPDRETVDEASQGVPLARLRELVRYWASDYDWRRFEAQPDSATCRFLSREG